MTFLDLINDLTWIQKSENVARSVLENGVIKVQLKLIFIAKYIGAEFEIVIKHRVELHPDNELEWQLDDEGELNDYFSEYINSYKTTRVDELIKVLAPRYLVERLLIIDQMLQEVKQ